MGVYRHADRKTPPTIAGKRLWTSKKTRKNFAVAKIPSATASVWNVSACEATKPAMRLSRRDFLRASTLLAGGGGSAAAYARFIEPDWFEVTSKTVGLPHLTKPLRLVHLSDLHASLDVPGALIEAGIDLAIAQKPDLVAITGDFRTRDIPDPAGYTRILAKLTAAAPVFACLGNHDGHIDPRHGTVHRFARALLTALKDAGIHLLHNAAETVDIGGQRLRIAGIGDLWTREHWPDAALTPRRPEALPVLVLDHNPDGKDELRPYDWDLLCCGHTHGGQFRIPVVNWAPYAPVNDRRFIEGLHRWQGRYLHVTRSVGNLRGLRFCCRPEVSLLKLVPA